MPPGQPVFRLRVTLRDVEPLVWRRLLIPASVRLDKLHRMLQAAIGWDDRHLHSFTIGPFRYGMQFDEYPRGELQERDVTVLRAFADAGGAVYEYDFGDSWRHDLEVEEVWRLPLGLRFGVCLDGENACPPEDCGGPPGYADLMARRRISPSNELDGSDVSLLEPFDPSAFDLAVANVRLQAVR